MEFLLCGFSDVLGGLTALVARMSAEGQPGCCRGSDFTAITIAAMSPRPGPPHPLCPCLVSAGMKSFVIHILSPRCWGQLLPVRFLEHKWLCRAQPEMTPEAAALHWWPPGQLAKGGFWPCPGSSCCCPGAFGVSGSPWHSSHHGTLHLCPSPSLCWGWPGAFPAAGPGLAMAQERQFLLEQEALPGMGSNNSNKALFAKPPVGNEGGKSLLLG